MRERLERLLTALKRLPGRLKVLFQPKPLRAGALCAAGLLCLGLTGVFANGVLVELTPEAVEVPKSAASAALRIDTSLYADLPDVVRSECVVQTETIPASIRYVEDDSLYLGETRLISEGTDGLAQVTTEKVYINGLFAYSRLVETEILTKPIHTVVLEGTKYRPASTGIYLWPTSGTLTSGFGPRSGAGSSFHKGLDIANETGTSVCAADAGLVVRADSEYSGYGNLIMVQHDNGDVTYYAHLSDYAVSAGEYVEQGQLIGYMGSTGVSTGSHLHFELRVGGEAVDPSLYLN